jgi:hypothetical protein
MSEPGSGRCAVGGPLALGGSGCLSRGRWAPDRVDAAAQEFEHGEGGQRFGPDRGVGGPPRPLRRSSQLIEAWFKRMRARSRSGACRGDRLFQQCRRAGCVARVEVVLGCLDGVSEEPRAVLGRCQLPHQLQQLGGGVQGSSVGRAAAVTTRSPSAALDGSAASSCWRSPGSGSGLPGAGRIPCPVRPE